METNHHSKLESQEEDILCLVDFSRISGGAVRTVGKVIKDRGMAFAGKCLPRSGSSTPLLAANQSGCILTWNQRLKSFCGAH